jgi:hypothetical protein
MNKNDLFVDFKSKIKYEEAKASVATYGCELNNYELYKRKNNLFFLQLMAHSLLMFLFGAFIVMFGILVRLI